ncbi:MAG: polysaccharide deacetylase family protein [Candidatus Firestonebacteria bacterium]|nr:polysaccharide deacetylase family protein [Candidatus Firestonebacteria bacterium]
MKLLGKFLIGFLGLALFSQLAWAEAGQGSAASVSVTAEPVPVLCYHRFGNYGPQDPYFVSTEELTRQFEILRNEGFTPITVSALLEGWAGKRALPPKPLLITIDDGYADFAHTALPIFKKFEFPATLFVYTHFIDSQRGLTHAQLRELEAQGFEIGSHSFTHPKLTKPTRLELAQGQAAFLERELKGSFDSLQAWLGHPVVSLAYPYGLWDTTVAQAAQAAGYRAMFTVDQGTNTAKTPRAQLKRIMIVHNTSDRMFKYLINDRPLEITERSLEPGARVPGPVTALTLTVGVSQREAINPRSWSALKGGIKCTWVYTAADGKLKVTLPSPWTHGTDAVMLVARGAQPFEHYKETWLATIVPPRAEGGK